MKIRYIITSKGKIDFAPPSPKSMKRTLDTLIKYAKLNKLDTYLHELEEERQKYGI